MKNLFVEIMAIDLNDVSPNNMQKNSEKCSVSYLVFFFFFFFSSVPPG